MSTTTKLLAIAAMVADKADSLGCGWSTQGGGMPDAADLDRCFSLCLDHLREARSPEERRKALEELSAYAVFALLLERKP